MIKVMAVSGYTAEGGAGRDPADIGKFHLKLELLFENRVEALKWLERNEFPAPELTFHPDIKES